MKILHRWRWSTIRWFRYFFHFFYTKLFCFEILSSIFLHLLFSKLNNILQVLQSIFIVWCFDHFEIKVFWNGKLLIIFFSTSILIEFVTFICEITSILFFDESFLKIISDSSMERLHKYIFWHSNSKCNFKKHE